MALAVFNQMTPVSNDECCPFCRDTVEDNPNEKWYGHLVNNGPVIHYIHENCLIEQIKRRHLRCLGECGQEIDANFLLSLKERILLLIKPFLVNTIGASGVSAVLAGAQAVNRMLPVLLAEVGTAEEMRATLRREEILLPFSEFGLDEQEMDIQQRVILMQGTMFLLLLGMGMLEAQGGDYRASLLALAINTALGFFGVSMPDDMSTLFPFGLSLFVLVGLFSSIGIEILRRRGRIL